MNPLKRTLLRSLTLPGAREVLSPSRRGVGTIFMLHRFTDPATGMVGDDVGELRRTLAFLRSRGYELIALAEMFRRLKEGGEGADLGVAFTLDDGYADQVRLAGPAFAEFDCPATIFVTTGFVDRAFWQWWDRIEHVFTHAARHTIQLPFAGATLEYRWDDGDTRDRHCQDFVERCKRVPDADKHAAILRLAQAAEVELPINAPPRYEPMTWDELRQWEGKGMNFGPHTVTHPILARTSDEQSRQELIGSWDRLKAMSGRPTPVFCYPNGQTGDFSEREIGTMREMGLAGAVVGTAGYADALEFNERPEDPFLVRRFAYPGDRGIAAQYVTGLERLRYGTGRPA
jgi:peptidoglycan/xylan/chitin deacetylase (PgdA/CDA1 family)